MAEFEELRLTVNLVDNVSAGMANIRKEMAQLSQSAGEVNQNFTNIAKSVQEIGKHSQHVRTASQDMKELKRGAEETARSLLQMGLAAREGIGSFPQLALGLRGAYQGLTAVNAAMTSLAPASRAVVVELAAVGVGVAAVGAAVAGYSISVFKFSREMFQLSQTARALGISFETMKSLTEQNERFGISAEQTAGQLARLQEVITDLSENNSRVRHEMLGKGLDPNWLNAYTMEINEYNRTNMAREKALEVQKALRAKGVPEIAVQGESNRLLRGLGQDPGITNRPPLEAPSPEEEARMRRYRDQSEAVNKIWRDIYGTIQKTTAEFLGMGLPLVAAELRLIKPMFDGIAFVVHVIAEGVRQIGVFIDDIVKKIPPWLKGAASGAASAAGEAAWNQFPVLKALRDWYNAYNQSKPGGEDGEAAKPGAAPVKPLPPSPLVETPPTPPQGPWVAPMAAPGSHAMPGQPQTMLPPTRGVAPRAPGAWAAPGSSGVVSPVATTNFDRTLLDSIKATEELTAQIRRLAGDLEGRGGLGGGGGAGGGGGGDLADQAGVNDIGVGRGVGGSPRQTWRRGGSGLAGLPGSRVPSTPHGSDVGPGTGKGAADAPASAPGGAAGGDLDRGKYEKMFAGTPLAGQYDQVVKAAAANNVPPSLVAGIMAEETGKGTSHMLAERNNPAGLMDPKTGMMKGKSFANIGEGIDAAAETIGKNYRKGGGTIEGMAKSYSPPGAANDPHGTNASWPAGVRKFQGQLAGTPAAGGAGDPTVPADILGRARQVALTGGPGAVENFMASQGYPKRGNWCGEFAASVVKSVGGTPPQNPAIASNWRNYGVPETGAPQPGDVAVARRGVRTGDTGSHVTFVESYDPKTGTFKGLGGNQRAGMESTFGAGEYDFRRPAPDRTALDRRAIDKQNGGAINSTGKLSVDVKAPAGTKVNYDGNNLLKSTQMQRQTQMLPTNIGPNVRDTADSYMRGGN